MEDNRADVFLIREAIASARVEAEISVVHDGDNAIRLLEQADADPRGGRPDLVILDINLPKRSGREVLRALRQCQHYAHTPVLVVTSSDSQRDRDEMSKLGASIYFRKPSDYVEFMKLGNVVKTLLQEEGATP